MWRRGRDESPPPGDVFWLAGRVVALGALKYRFSLARIAPVFNICLLALETGRLLVKW
jgi:hypothetical protein